MFFVTKQYTKLKYSALEISLTANLQLTVKSRDISYKLLWSRNISEQFKTFCLDVIKKVSSK